MRYMLRFDQTISARRAEFDDFKCGSRSATNIMKLEASKTRPLYAVHYAGMYLFMRNTTNGVAPLPGSKSTRIAIYEHHMKQSACGHQSTITKRSTIYHRNFRGRQPMTYELHANNVHTS
jgi:hypothetical protein